MRMGKNTQTLLALLLIIFLTCNLYGAVESNGVSLEKMPYTFDFDQLFCKEIFISFEGSFPNLPDEMMVYKVIEPNVTEDFVRELGARHFGIGEKTNLSRSSYIGRYKLKGEKCFLKILIENGSFSLERSFSPKEKMEYLRWKQKAKKQDYPSKAECRNIAESYLKVHSLLPEDAYFRGVADNTSGMNVMSVAFGRMIGGYKNWGAGAQIIFHVNHIKELDKLHIAWQKLVPYKSYPVKTSQDALLELQSGKGVLDECDGTVEKITFRYYTSPIKQQYVQPIYYFECSGKKGRFTGEVTAIKDEYLKSREETFKELQEEKRAGSTK